VKIQHLADYIANAKKVKAPSAPEVKPEPEKKIELKCTNSFSALEKTLAEIADKPDSSDELLDTCNAIIESMNMYHMTVIEEMAKIDVKPVVDMSKLDAINNRLLSVIQTLATRKPKEWDFKIERDMMGEMINVNAKEVMH